MTCGCAGALDMCITTLSNRGQNILIPRPGFGLYSCLSVPRGVEARCYNLLVSIYVIFWLILVKVLIAMLLARLKHAIIDNG